ncbi:MAG TPA: phosphoglycerate mutase family protein [Terriglobales bacterium]|nr:phosphoglycerate mutase family protein [Terriglobales bacterium]
MTVYFLRHASAGERVENPAKDAKRALDAIGMEQAVRMGAALAAWGAQLDAIVSSPLKRCTQTAALVANEIGHVRPIETATALRPEATFAEFQQLLRAHAGREAILLVGHNPLLSECLGKVLGDSVRPARIQLRRGALAKVDFKRGAGYLHWLLPPKLLLKSWVEARARRTPTHARR